MPLKPLQQPKRRLWYVHGDDPHDVWVHPNFTAAADWAANLVYSRYCRKTHISTRYRAAAGRGGH